MAVDRAGGDVEVLEYLGPETQGNKLVGKVTRHYYRCPVEGCDARICEWMDCPECLWYDEDVWERSIEERKEPKGEQTTLTDGGRPQNSVELICPNCGDVHTVPSHTTTAEDGEYRPCSWRCRR